MPQEGFEPRPPHYEIDFRYFPAYPASPLNVPKILFYNAFLIFLSHGVSATFPFAWSHSGHTAGSRDGYDEAY